MPAANPDDDVRFRFIFDGDRRPPALGAGPDPDDPPPPPAAPVVNPADYLGHDPNESVRYSLDDDEEEEEGEKDKSKAGIQWDQLMAKLDKFGGWYMANIIWAAPVSGVLAIAFITIPVVGAVKKNKAKKAIQEQFAAKKKQREAERAAGGTVAGPGIKPKALAKKAPKKAPPDAPAPPTGKHVYLCFTGYDEGDANALRKHLSKYKYDIRCRKLDKGVAKMFDNETVDLVCSARAVILVASGSAYKSERVQQEIELAKDEGKPIVPIYLDDTDLPENLGFLAEDPDYVYFDNRNAKSSILGIITFLNGKGIPPT